MKKTAKIRFLALFALIMITFPTTAQTQEIDSIQIAPTFVVGDKWVYDGGFNSLEDAKAGKNSKWKEDKPAIRIVTEITDKTIVIENPQKDKRFIYDKNLNELERHEIKKNQITIYKPFWPIYRYPMKVGDKYRINFSQTWGDKGDAYFYVTVRVIGWENITVPAGAFKALKVEMSGSYEHPPNYVRANITFTVWLAQETKMHPVLMSDERWWENGSRETYKSLKSFELKK
jgi:hypothetical protein